MPNLLLTLEHMKWINLFLLMRVQLTAVQHIADVLGQYRGERLLRKPSSAVGSDEYYS